MIKTHLKIKAKTHDLKIIHESICSQCTLSLSPGNITLIIHKSAGSVFIGNLLSCSRLDSHGK